MAVLGASQTREQRRSTPERNWRLRRKLPLYIMLVPAVTALFLFHYIPMVGVIMAFQNYKLLLGFLKSPFVGLANFQRIFAMPDFWRLVRSTVIIASGKIVAGQVASLVFALLLNEVRCRLFKSSVQTISYALHFLSWVLFGGILLDLLAGDGAVNRIITTLGFAPIQFLILPSVFPWTLIFSDVWKGFGMGAVIYLAALADVSPELYEAAAVDGASRLQRMRHVTLPGIASTVVVLACLNLGWVLNAGMEQVLVLYNPAVYRTGDVISTFVYRVGLQSAQFSLATTVGLFKSAVGLVLIFLSYYLAYKLANYRIF